ncbi:MAG: hypothetical protein DRG83_08590 [Deltaproteobacteria bacterium]|nr:MAG: hypothetical protein DRG83_08590 [Deltaproteobacteria bacterium]
MEDQNLYLGFLEKESFLKTDSKRLLMSKISPEMAQSPESAPLDIKPEDVGKMALVRGTKSGDVLYSADILQVLSPFESILVQVLLKKGVLSLEEFESETSVVEPEEKKVPEKKKLCALVIGHKKKSPGAVNEKLHLTEFDFNEDLALKIEKKVRLAEVQRVYRRTYSELPGDINALNPDFIVSLHCNAFNKRASGTEVLYYHKSAKSEKMAKIVLKHLVDFLKLPNRGIKPKTAEDRGGYLLRYTNAPCVIAEPFFIDNNDDLAKALSDKDGLAEAYARAIDEISLIVV